VFTSTCLEDNLLKAFPDGSGGGGGGA